MGLALSVKGIKLPTGKNRLLGAAHNHFEVFIHGNLLNRGLTNGGNIYIKFSSKKWFMLREIRFGKAPDFLIFVRTLR